MPQPDRQSFQLPTPPPPIHTRSNEMDRPSTPPQEAFISPQQTPQGSPSKHHAPPGTFDLPHVFENAMRLLPTMGSPSKSKPGTPSSPNKPNNPHTADDTDYSTHDLTTVGPASPTRKSNTENTPPGARPGLQKEPSYLTHAAQSRQELYRTREADQSSRYTPAQQRLSAEELEKARKPQVKRLANVTQLCKCLSERFSRHSLTFDRLPRLLLRPPHLRAYPPESPFTIQGTKPITSCDARCRLQRRPYTVPWTGASESAKTPNSAEAGRLPDPHAGGPGRLRAGVFGPEEGYARGVRTEGDEQEAALQA